MKLYRFSPIRSRQELEAAVRYVAEEVLGLARKVCGRSFPIGYLTVFAHYEEEYAALSALIRDLGAVEPANNGVRAALREPIRFDGGAVASLRIRKPDPYRMQVGCGDLSVPDYRAFKEDNLKISGRLRLIERNDYEMIEFFDPDSDVLAYVVSK